MAKDALGQAGLSANEADVYLILLKLQSALASEIAEKSTISRPHIYDTLHKLVEKGLASYVIKNNRQYFRAANPERLLEIITEKQKSLESALPSLLSLYAPREKKPVVEVFEGTQGLKTILKTILAEAKRFDCFGAALQLEKFLPVNSGKFFLERQKKNISARFLCSSETRIAKSDESRQLLAQYSSPITFLIWNEKVAVFIWAESPTVVLMENKQLSNSFRNQFELLWEQKAVTLSGKEGFVTNFEKMLKTGKTMYGFGGLRDVWAKLYPEEYNRLHEEKIKKKILSFFIVGKKQFNPKLYNTPFTKVKVIEQKFVRPSTVWVFGNNFSVWLPSNPPVYTTIESKELADSYRAQFKLLWNKKQKAQ